MTSMLRVLRTEEKPAPAISPDDLLTLEEAMQALHCKRTKLYELMKSGELPSLTVGGTRFITRPDVARFLAARARLSRPPGRGR